MRQVRRDCFLGLLLRTQTLLGSLDELLEPRDVQEAEALRDGVEQQEAVRPADGRLQGRRRALLGGGEKSVRGRCHGDAEERQTSRDAKEEEEK